MAWRTSNRRTRLPKNWGKLRSACLQRDGHRCQWVVGTRQCRAEATEVHHLEEAGRYGGADNDKLEALVSLCSEHHQIATLAYARERKAAKAAKAATLAYAGHPGLVK